MLLGFKPENCRWPGVDLPFRGKSSKKKNAADMDDAYLPWRTALSLRSSVEGSTYDEDEEDEEDDEDDEDEEDEEDECNTCLTTVSVFLSLAAWRSSAEKEVGLPDMIGYCLNGVCD